MKKIPLIFKFDHDTRKMTRTINPVAQWVFDGEGVATRKYDGTACAVITALTPERDGIVLTLHKRRCLKPKQKTPLGFLPIEMDEVTGKCYGWLPIEPSDKFHQEAWIPGLPEGTYELIGPKVQGNPEGQPEHMLMPHNDAEVFSCVPRNYDGLRDWLAPRDIEGLVFHHRDGRMAKIRKKDFGLERRC